MPRIAEETRNEISEKLKDHPRFEDPSVALVGAPVGYADISDRHPVVRWFYKLFPKYRAVEYVCVHREESNYREQ